MVPIEVRRPVLSRYLRGVVFRCHKCTFSCGGADKLRSHMARHDDVRPYRCRLCYFDCTRLSDLEAHLGDKHQVRIPRIPGICLCVPKGVTKYPLSMSCS